MFLGVWRLTGQGGATLSPILFAVIAETLGYGSSFVFIAASAAVVTMLLVFYVPETRTRGVRRNAPPLTPPPLSCSYKAPVTAKNA